LFASTLEAAGRRGLIGDVETLHLDRGYDSRATRTDCRQFGLVDIVCARQRRAGTKPGKRRAPKPRPLGLRWPVERTNSWLSNFGQMRRNTDRRIAHRLTQMSLAITLLITAKLIDWRNRWAA
jgi:transposase